MSAVKVDHKTLIANAVAHFAVNCQRFLLLNENFISYTECVIKVLENLFASTVDKSKEIKARITDWFGYWIVVRDEYCLVHDGAIVSPSQRYDNEDFIFERAATEIKSNLKAFQFILPSSEGFRCWLLNNPSVYIYIFTFISTLN